MAARIMSCTLAKAVTSRTCRVSRRQSGELCIAYRQHRCTGLLTNLYLACRWGHGACRRHTNGQQEDQDRSLQYNIADAAYLSRDLPSHRQLRWQVESLTPTGNAGQVGRKLIEEGGWAEVPDVQGRTCGPAAAQQDVPDIIAWLRPEQRCKPGVPGSPRAVLDLRRGVRESGLSDLEALTLTGVCR